MSGICDGCGEWKEQLREVNCAPVVGASICEDCAPEPEPIADAIRHFGGQLEGATS